MKQFLALASSLKLPRSNTAPEFWGPSRADLQALGNRELLKIASLPILMIEASPSTEPCHWLQCIPECMNESQYFSIRKHHLYKKL